jgi:gliding motility-associated-like protein
MFLSKMKKLLTSLLFLLFSVAGWSTHNRAGEITYEWLGGFKYRFTIHICTAEGSSVADRPELEIWYGDGQRDTVPRQSEVPVPSIGTFTGSENKYVVEHTYEGPGTYYIEVLDPNRNGNILNIDNANSINVAFCIRTVLVINPFFSTGNNSSIAQNFPCPEIGCAGVKYCYNGAAFDPDGDSLSYALSPCMRENGNDDGCDFMPLGVFYVYPNQVQGAGGTISIDQQNGTLCWDAPQLAGEYNIAIIVSEWRYGVLVGQTLRDIQVTINNVCNNDPPNIVDLVDTCVVAGTNLSFNISATDPNGDIVTINEYGQPFSLSVSPATFPNTSGINPLGVFNWNTDCAHIRSTPYQVYFIAEDNDPVAPMIDVASMYIRVIPPPVSGLTASPFANTMVLNWTANSCTNVTGYRIYRKSGNGNPLTENCCDVNTPIELGYTLIGSVSGRNTTTFTDATGLVIGNQYCYVIVAFTADGSVSCPSDEACNELKLDVPIIINVSVGNTDVASGIDTVRWFHPIELDTVSNFPGPYFYKIYKVNGFGNPSQLIFTTPQSPQLFLTQKELIIDTLNTIATAHTYRCELFQFNSGNGTETYIGPTNNASSIFLSITPQDQALALSWQVNVPWDNDTFRIQRETPTGSGNFVTIATTDTTFFIDTGLVNGITYCYRIESVGAYSLPEIPAPLFNFSQEVCSAPIDLTPPCAPNLSINNDCEQPLNTLTWNNPNNSCADDVMSYNVYFTPTEGGTFTLLATLNSFDDTTLTHVLANGSVAGCYYVTAVDSVQYSNESIPSNVVCGDNCPSYFLPNVFSPNGDGRNDEFIPFPYRFVDSIDLHIYNRWGTEIFTTSDPDINWNGTVQETNEPCSDGVYYFICTVYTIRVTGLVPIQLNGFVHLYRDNGASSQ